MASTHPGFCPPSWPRWMHDVARSVAVRSQIVLSGNIRDLVLLKDGDESAFLSIRDCLRRLFETLGYEAIVWHDRVAGIDVLANSDSGRASLSSLLGLDLPEGPAKVSLEALGPLLERVVLMRDRRLAVVLDYASRLARDLGSLSAEEFAFFVTCERLSYEATAGPTSRPRSPLFNPLVWLVNRENDVPSWLVSNNVRISPHRVPRPDYDVRREVAQQLCGGLDGFAATPLERQNTLLQAVADQTDGMPVAALVAIAQLAIREGVAFTDVEDAVSRYKVGIADNPWKSGTLRERVIDAKSRIDERVKGQAPAVNKTLDIIKRSIAGLSGAQTSRRSGRPRGILFFAGPTGVGKTELAKALTEVLFGNEQAYLRFDMSEYSAEHSDARLLGAPPGYLGHDSGGQLTNAIRERPFSVVLFDEIEKAHPRILDKFLQILEDGRLTDGAGNTVYFSEAVIIFTSNLGIVARGPSGEFVDNVTGAAPYDVVEAKVKQAIVEHFRFELRRPELLNRIGDNIVVFNFVARAVAETIFEMMLTNVERRAAVEHKIALSVSAPLRDKLREWCVADLSLGGRGIGNILETRFVNPVARHIFDASPSEGAVLNLVDVVDKGGVFTVVVE